MCFSPKYDYKTNEIIPPNTGRTFWLFEEIQQRFKVAIPLETYIHGCHIIAHAAARVLQQHGIPARPKLSLQPVDGGKRGFKGHVVVDQDGLLLDFKAASFANKHGQVVVMYDSVMEPWGWVPPGKQFADVTPETLRQMYPRQRDNLNSLAGTTEEIINRAEHFERDFNLCVTSCADLFD